MALIINIVNAINHLEACGAAENKDVLRSKRDNLTSTIKKAKFA